MFEGFLQAAVSGLHAPATSWRMIRAKPPSQKGLRGCRGVAFTEAMLGRCQAAKGHSGGLQFIAVKRGGA